ncbi:hypothetical protein BMS3Bbin06_01261 [bacterium BMS3Bbin06]|nr:hypothetical protein BMS3Abin08_00704 [bacterium BMS3Abin08]GBE34731.1 hypothetical protein BMS3Bbin06_01261 [bacterium BMS3Bbin06]
MWKRLNRNIEWRYHIVRQSFFEGIPEFFICRHPSLQWNNVRNEILVPPGVFTTHNGDLFDIGHFKDCRFYFPGLNTMAPYLHHVIFSAEILQAAFRSHPPQISRSVYTFLLVMRIRHKNPLR